MPNRAWFPSIRINIKTTAKNLIIPLFFVLPILALYLFEPDKFQYVWKGRAPYLFFLWLLFIELALAWKKLPPKAFKATSHPRILVAIAISTLPLVYVVGTYVLGLNHKIVEIGKLLGVPSRPGLEWFLQYSWPLSLEYLMFTFFSPLRFGSSTESLG